jgi:hypothetical protein
VPGEGHRSRPRRTVTLPATPTHDAAAVELKKPLQTLVPVERIELPTFGLQNRCSTAELNRRLIEFSTGSRYQPTNVLATLALDGVPSIGPFVADAPGRLSGRTIGR